MSKYEHAQSILKGRTSRKVAHATYLMLGPCGDINLRYHDTNVVTLHDDGTFTLRNGGYFSLTTRKRIEDWAPVRISGPLARNWNPPHQSLNWSGNYCREPHEGGPWMVTGCIGYRGTGTPAIEFEEGMTVDETGRPLDFTTEVTR